MKLIIDFMFRGAWFSGNRLLAFIHEIVFDIFIFGPLTTLLLMSHPLLVISISQFLEPD